MNIDLISMFVCLFGFINDAFKHLRSTVPACIRCTLTNVLQDRNAMPQTQDRTPHPVTVYRHRTWQPTPSLYTDAGHDTPPHHNIDTRHDTRPHHSIQMQDMTPHPVTIYKRRTWHPTPSQYTDAGNDTPPRHSKQTQDMTPHPVTVYRRRTWHPTLSQYTDKEPTCNCAIHCCGTIHWNK